MVETILLNGGEPSPAKADESSLDFLVTEGLDLLTLYRQIESPEVRASVIEFLRNLVGARL